MVWVSMVRILPSIGCRDPRAAPPAVIFPCPAPCPPRPPPDILPLADPAAESQAQAVVPNPSGEGRAARHAHSERVSHGTLDRTRTRRDGGGGTSDSDHLS